MSHANSNDLLPLLIILESIGKIEVYATRFTNAFDFFQNDDQMQFNASLLLLINIGEQANRLSETLRDKYPNVPFRQIRSLRNRVAHDYTGIDYEMVFDIVKTDLPALKPSLAYLIQAELGAGVFDQQELNVARQSHFYRHIDFTLLAP
ncbi:HepT-like ribonuclease domain-containing protein [Dyadobacter sp. OTU695]|uniref:HepT-like ribonuclease domain-containing protein n=1 Tax=Dyadobacter sp. OTU695 TaxID=3043860 RepID=UPI00313B691E